MSLLTAGIGAICCPRKSVSGCVAASEIESGVARRSSKDWDGVASEKYSSSTAAATAESPSRGVAPRAQWTAIGEPINRGTPQNFGRTTSVCAAQPVHVERQIGMTNLLGRKFLRHRIRPPFRRRPDGGPSRRGAPAMEHRRRQRKGPKCAVAFRASLEMREQIAAPFAVERALPKTHKILTCLETVHHLFSALRGFTRRAA